jgi:RNA polymerase sigma factor (sigma-70 family)
MSKIDIAEAFELYRQRLLYIGFSITRDWHLAEDIVQESFIKAFKKIETIEDNSKLGAWLSSIATRTAIDFVRRERKRKGLPLEAEILDILGKQGDQDVEAEVATVMLKEQIQCAIEDMNDSYRDVLLLKVTQCLNEHEIASVLGLNLNTVKVRIHRGRKQLKLLFQEQLSA